MARIAGVNIPENKHIEISLTHIFGIGRKTAQDICVDLKIDYTRKISDLSEEEIENIRGAITNYTVEGDLRRNISTNIKTKGTCSRGYMEVEPSLCRLLLPCSVLLAYASQK